MVRWGIIGCGDVTEVKSGPGFQRASGSTLLAVTRRDHARAEDFARRHGVPRVHESPEALLADPDIDAVYIATPPASHARLACMAADAGKPCLVEKPMALNHAECVRMLESFERASVPLWVAYYRRALPRFLLVRELLRNGTLGTVTSVGIEVREPLASGEASAAWRFDPSLSGGGLFVDKGSHTVDMLDFLLGPVVSAGGIAVNTGGAYPAEDVVAATFRMQGSVLGTGLWNFNANEVSDRLVLTLTAGEITTSLFSDADVVVTAADGRREVHDVRNPPHVHQPLIQSIVDEMAGHGACESTGASGARASRVLDLCLGVRQRAAGFHGGGGKE
jgi:predicted dehydrogenase